MLYRMDSMRIKIIKPGVLSTIQDMGRHLYLEQAVPVSGAMDTLSARMANMALGNDDTAAVIEFTYAGAQFEAETDLLIAWSGNGAVLAANDKKIAADRPVFIPKGTIVNLNSKPDGSHTYLAVAGGWNVPEVLGSRSTYIPAAIGGLQGRALLAGDVLDARANIHPLTKNILKNLKGLDISYPTWSLHREHLLPADKRLIRVMPAHEFTWFDGPSLIGFLSEPYTLSLQSNRMGYHLEGVVINRLVKDELLSTAVAPGTIQVTGNGKMILLMADCQTTGGYPRIAQVAVVDMPLCGQLKPGDTIRFEEISRHEAEMLYIEREKKLSTLKNAVGHKFL